MGGCKEDKITIKIQGPTIRTSGLKTGAISCYSILRFCKTKVSLYLWWKFWVVMPCGLRRSVPTSEAHTDIKKITDFREDASCSLTKIDDGGSEHL
jgi:hypothetical protein